MVWGVFVGCIRRCKEGEIICNLLFIKQLEIRSGVMGKRYYETAALERLDILKNIGDSFFAMVLDSSIADIAGAGEANGVGGDTVGGRINEVIKAIPKYVETIGLKATFKDGVLNAHPKVFAENGDFVKTLGLGDVVGDEGQHLSGAAAVSGGFGG